MTTQIDRIPLARLYVAPENARFGAQDLGDLDALAASILEVGDLIDPLHVYGPDDEGNFAVWDGGRRWSALVKLVKAKGKAPKLPPALVDGVPCLIGTKEQALLQSLATFNREQMHPADEFLAYKRMFDTGMEPARIAAACAVPVRRVSQLLRLNAVAPEVLDAFKGGELALDAVEAFSICTDHDRQRAVLEATRQKGRAPDAWAIRRAFRETALSAKDPWAKFVGREAYEAAGGTFLVDLFEESEDFANGDLVKLLAQQKLDKMLEDLRAEGWAKVEFADNYNYNYASGYDQEREPEGGWSDEFKASAVAFIKQQYDGQMEIRRGYVRRQRAEGATGAAAVKPDQSLYGWGHKGHGVMTQAATQATRAALLADPGAAYDAMLSHLVLVTFFQYPDDCTASRLTKDHRWGQPTVETMMDAAFDAVGEAWTARLEPFTATDYRGGVCKDVTGLCDFLAGLEADEKAQLVAYCFGRSLWAWEPKSNERKPDRWSHLGWMARRANLDMGAAWTANEDFCKGGSKDALLGAWAEIEAMGARTPSNKGWPNVPKAQLAAGVANRGGPVGWLPKLLRELVAPGASVKQAKPRRKAKVNPAPEASADDLPASVRALANGTAKPIPEPESEEA